MKIKDLLTYELKKDTRNNNNLHVYKIKNQLSKEDYIKLNNSLKQHGCYYSRFVKGFISKTVLDENLELNESIETAAKPKSKRIEYHKNLLDYITLEDYKEYLKEYAKENLHNSWYYRNTSFKNDNEALEKYTEDLFSNLENALNYGCFGKLNYIRECIIHKSLGYNLDNRFSSNGDSIYYKAIWDKLPIIEDLKMTEQSYSAVWGYDQTNVDIAYKLNKKVWGLDVFVDNGKYYLVRMKNDRFNDGVRYFHRDHNPQETFKRDASQTGQYR